MVKTLPSNAGVQVQSLVGELRSDMPRSQKIKTENRNNIVTNSIKTFKKVHIKQFFKKTHITRSQHLPVSNLQWLPLLLRAS